MNLLSIKRHLTQLEEPVSCLDMVTDNVAKN